MSDILDGSFCVLNVGLPGFAEDLKAQGVDVIDIHWRPPARGRSDLARVVADMADDDIGIGAEIKAANEKAFNGLMQSQPVLKAVVPARDVLRDMTPMTVLHAGPPIQWDEMAGPMRGAVAGGLLYEGLAHTPAEAEELASSGEIDFAPCHSRDAVGPMAGVITASMPVFVVEDECSGTTAYSNLNEGWGRTLRFGAHDEGVIQRLRWMESVLAPSLNQAFQALGGIDVKEIIARALHMGDECHNRDLAATSLLFKSLAPMITRVVDDSSQRDEILTFLSGQEHFFLNVGMASSKASLLSASGIDCSTMVTAIARNGREVGITISGTGQTWFTYPANTPEGLFFPGFSSADANRDLGDSAITETCGIGAFAMAASPAIVGFVGGTPEDARKYTEEMYKITLGENPNFTIPVLGFRGTPTGIDVRLVVETGIQPVVNTGIAHKEPGHGLVGAGVVRIPYEVFEQALLTVHKKMLSVMDGEE